MAKEQINLDTQYRLIAIEAFIAALIYAFFYGFWAAAGFGISWVLWSLVFLWLMGAFKKEGKKE